MQRCLCLDLSFDNLEKVSNDFYFVKWRVCQVLKILSMITALYKLDVFNFAINDLLALGGAWIAIKTKYIFGRILLLSIKLKCVQRQGGIVSTLLTPLGLFSLF